MNCDTDLCVCTYSRDDKRYTEKKNKSERARRKKEDTARLRGIVDTALAVDPRIKRIRQEEKEAREAKKKNKGGVNGTMNAKQKAEEEKRKAEEEAKKKEEEEKVRSPVEPCVNVRARRGVRSCVSCCVADGRCARSRLLAQRQRRRKQRPQMPRRRRGGNSERQRNRGPTALPHNTPSCGPASSTLTYASAPPLTGPSILPSRSTSVSQYRCT